MSQCWNKFVQLLKITSYETTAFIFVLYLHMSVVSGLEEVCDWEGSSSILNLAGSFMPHIHSMIFDFFYFLEAYHSAFQV